MSKKGISDTILDASPAARGRMTVKDGKLVQRKKPEKRMAFTRQELIDFLVKGHIRSVRTLWKLRVPERDPNFCHYRREFGTWNEAIRAAFGAAVLSFRPPATGRYIVEMMIRYKLYKCIDYKKFREKHPEILPSYDSLIYQFKSFKLAVTTARYHSLNDMADEYLKLRRRLGRKPTCEDCEANNIDLTRLLRFFKKKANFDEFIADLERVQVK